MNVRLKKASLIAHSFGGLVATLFAEKYPKKVNALILAGALFAQQETYDHILKTTKKNYKEKADSLMLLRISTIENLNKNGAEYRKQCFDMASLNNYFKMPFPTFEANELRKLYEQSEFSKSNIRNSQAPISFYKNEINNNIDTKPILKELKKQKVKLFAIYGLQDKIFSYRQLMAMKNIVGRNSFKALNNCSHYLFVDQQTKFIDTIIKWMK